MGFPKGMLSEKINGKKYLELPEPERTPIKIKYNCVKVSLFHKTFPKKQYNSLDFEGKNALRKQWHMVPLIGNVGNHVKEKAEPARASTNGHHKPGEDKFPRTQAGAIAFIRAWNSAKDGNEFVQRHGENNGSFWAAMTHKANMFREKGIKLKILKKQKGEAHLYDWDLLKQVAAETQE